MEANRYRAGSAAYRVAIRNVLAAIASELRGERARHEGGQRVFGRHTRTDHPAPNLAQACCCL